MDDTQVEKKRRRGIYLLPNLFTTAGLFCGFYAIVAAESGNFAAAAVAIFIAMITDALDGRVARLTNTQTDFGVQYDSLTDLVAFGVAPALVMYQWALSSMRDYGNFWAKIGWLAAFLFTACAALRLARFNTQVSTADKRFFQGLPSPAAAGLVAGLVWTAHDFALTGGKLIVPALIVTVGCALLMVSNVRFHSFKELDFSNKVPFVMALVLVLVFVSIAMDPPTVMFAMLFVYALSGPVITVRYRRARLAQRHQEEDSDAGL